MQSLVIHAGGSAPRGMMAIKVTLAALIHITAAACSAPATSGPPTSGPPPSNAISTAAANTAPAVTTPPPATAGAPRDPLAVLFGTGETVGGGLAGAPRTVPIDEAGPDREADLRERGFVSAARQVIGLTPTDGLVASVWRFEAPAGATAEFEAITAPSPDCTQLADVAGDLATATGAITNAWSCPSYMVSDVRIPAEATVQLIVGNTLIRVAHQGPGSATPAAAAVLVTVATALAQRVGG